MQHHTRGRTVKTPHLSFPAAALTVSELLCFFQEASPSFPMLLPLESTVLLLLFPLLSYVEAYTRALVSPVKGLAHNKALRKICVKAMN